MWADLSWERSSSDSVKRGKEGKKGEGRREEKEGGKWEEKTREKGRRREGSSYIYISIYDITVIHVSNYFAALLATCSYKTRQASSPQ